MIFENKGFAEFSGDDSAPAGGGRLRLLAALCGSLLLGACGGGAGTSGSGGIDPLVADFGIAYVVQPTPVDDDEDIRDPGFFNPGGDLIFRDLASPNANERNITSAVTGGMGDVRDVEVSHDGAKLLFSLRLPDIPGLDPDDQPTWNLWEYEIATDTLTRVIDSDIIAEEGQDIAPHYLPDGRIIFSSTRQRTAKAMLTDEGKPQFSAQDENRQGDAYVLHVVDHRNGIVQASDIKQVSFNQSHDLDPMVLSDGRVLFSRWDNVANRDGINLYTMYPDGTRVRPVYGHKSHDTGTNGATIEFVETRETADGRILALLKQSQGNFQGGDVVAIDVQNYVENVQATAVNSGILTGPAQASVSFGDVRNDDTPSPNGRLNSFYPLWDGTDRSLITWTPCRLMENGRIVPCTPDRLTDPNAVEAPPLYSVYLYDPATQTQQPVFQPQEGLLYRDVVAAQSRALPLIHFDTQGPVTADYDFDPDPNGLIAEGVGIVNIRSVYDFDGVYNPMGAAAPDIATLADPVATVADARPARFIRIVKAVSMPDNDLVNLNGLAFGRSSAQLMREIIGYAPVEPDGSVRVKVPANIPFAISVLDKDGKRISDRHQNWLQLRPGEIMTCNGCHDANAGTSHGRSDAFDPLYPGKAAIGYFPNTDNHPSTEANQTMAEARTAPSNDPSARSLSVDIHYQDVWTAGQIAGAPFDYQYADLDVTMTHPVSAGCQAAWNNLCRTVIHYEAHIHPLWNLPRGAADADTCTNCHNRVDNMGADMVPAGQLDLADGLSANNFHFIAYQELLFNDREQILNMGVLEDRSELVFDNMGNPVDADGDGNQDVRFFNVSPSMSANGAIASARFFDMFSNAGDPRNAVTNHVGFLTPAELKLLAEWLDIGAQYFNDPFAVPP